MSNVFTRIEEHIKQVVKKWKRVWLLRTEKGTEEMIGQDQTRYEQKKQDKISGAIRSAVGSSVVDPWRLSERPSRTVWKFISPFSRCSRKYE